MIGHSPEGLSPRQASPDGRHRYDCLGTPLAIIVNGEVIAAPIVRGRIADQALITDDFTREQVQGIAAGLQR
jgi:preprotein translocase subunit SecD